MADLTRHIDRIEQQIRGGRQIDAAATAMADSLREATARYLGGGLSMSGAGSASIDVGDRTSSRLSVRSGGVYGLADGGRRRAVAAEAEQGSALSTPWGPRQSVKGSTWAGFDITGRHGRDAIRAAIAAYIDNLEFGNG